MKKLTLLFLSLLIILIAYSQSNYGIRTQNTNIDNIQIDSLLASELQAVLDDAIESYDIKGISAALITEDNEVWTGVAGISHDTVTIKPDILLGAASITKNFMAAIVLQLYEEGDLNLSDSLHKWLPSFENIDSTITIKQLLNHTSGVYNYSEHLDYVDSIYVPGSRIWTPEEVIDTFVLEPYFPPGSDYKYSNTNYLLIGLIIKAVTGNIISYELNDRLLDPLELNSTFLFPEEGYEGIRSHCWYFIEDSLHDVTIYVDTTAYSAVSTSGGMLSIPEDLVRWSKGLFEEGILNDSTLGLMITPSEHSNYGLGTAYQSSFGFPIYGHSGSFMYQSAMYYVPDFAISIVVMTNSSTKGAYIFWNRLFKTYKTITSVSQYEVNNDYRIYPNPFSTSTTIEYSLTTPQTVRITFYNQLGKQVDMIEQRQITGTQQVTWNPANLPPGIYYFRLQTGEQVASGKMVLMR